MIAGRLAARGIKEVSHAVERGETFADLLLGVLSLGLSGLVGGSPEIHTVVLEDDGNRGVGKGNTYKDAVENALEALHKR